MRAAFDNDVERVRELFRIGCPLAIVNARVASGHTALHFASICGNEALVRELMAYGADINIKCNGGWTPMMWASFIVRLDIVRVLCDAPDIDLAVRTSTGKSALVWALACSHVETAAFLRSRGVPE